MAIPLLSSFMRGEPLVAKAATICFYGVLPLSLYSSIIYSPPSDRTKKRQEKKAREAAQSL